MKIYNKILLAAAVVSGLFAVSCEDQPDAFKLAGGVPTVNYIRSVDIEQADVLLTGAYMGNQICLVGENLRSIHELWFNDQKAVLNTSLITDNTLIVSVPNVIPTEVSNKIYMHTRDGEIVTYDFSILIPGPTITGMSCEYAAAGSVATLYGDYFIDDPNVPFEMSFGDVPVTDLRSITKTAVSFVVPEAPANEKISVSTIYGTAKSVFQYKDTRGLMFDFDGVTGLGNHGWHNRDILTDDTAISGNYVRLGDGATEMTEDGGWNDGQFSFEYWCGSWDTPQNVTSGDGIALFNLVDFSDFANMSLKFEMCIPSASPWSAGAMQIAFEGYDLVTISGNPIDGYSGEVAGANAWAFNNDNGKGAWGRALYRPWAATGSYHTDDKWITVTIPVSDFIYDYEGTPTNSGPGKPDDFASLTIFVVGGGVNGTPCTPLIKIDNIRAVPNR